MVLLLTLLLVELMGFYFMWWGLLIVIRWCRNVLLKLSRLSTCLRIWTKTPLIDMVLILLSCIGESFSCTFLENLIVVLCLGFDELNDNGRLPVPRRGQVLGLVGANGIGKSTALKILAGKLKPNLGRFTVITILWLALLLTCLRFYCIHFISFSFAEPPWLAGNFNLLPRIWIAGLLYSFSRG